jgi:hypothetical protein
MSKRTVRSMITGTALVMTLTVGLPAVTEAAGFGPALRDGDVLELVLHWFSDFWNGNPAGNAGNAGTGTGMTRTAGTGTAPGTAAACGGDQGVCIDPNGGR